MTTARAIIIGDEILSGKTQDTNSHYLSKVLFEQGVRLLEIRTIPDEVELIASVVKEFSNSSDFVFTTGGIGPTHDDKTYESVAKAFGYPTRLHNDAFKKFCSRYDYDGDSVNEYRKRMSIFPDPCSVLDVPDLWVPVVVVKNVYIYPGVPELFRYMLENTRKQFEGVPLCRRKIYTHLVEGEIAEALDRIQNSCRSVAIGSYPKFNHPSNPALDFKVMVSIEGEVQNTVDDIAEQIQCAIDGFELDGEHGVGK